MNYLKAMKNVLGLNPSFLQKNSSLKALQAYSIVNILVLGLIYGSSAAFFSRFIMADLGLSSSANIAKNNHSRHTGCVSGSCRSQSFYLGFSERGGWES